MKEAEQDYLINDAKRVLGFVPSGYLLGRTSDGTGKVEYVPTSSLPVSVGSMTGWELNATAYLNGEVERTMSGDPVYGVGVRMDNAPWPTRTFDTLVGTTGLLQTVGQQWDRAITYARYAGDPIAMEEWVRIADPNLTANGFDMHLTAAGDIAKKVRDL
jgi:hypothetical protein